MELIRKTYKLNDLSVNLTIFSRMKSGVYSFSVASIALTATLAQASLALRLLKVRQFDRRAPRSHAIFRMPEYPMR